MRRRLLFLLAWSALATLPTALLSEWMGWELVDPAGYLAELAWTPIWLWAQLKAFALLEGGGARPRASMVLQAFSAEWLLALRLCKAALLGLIPALALLSWGGWSWAVPALALPGLAPGLLYVLRRLFAAPLILFKDLAAAAALDESAKLTKGKLASVLGPLVLAKAAALGLEGLAQLSFAAALACLPAAFLIDQVVIFRCYRKIAL